MTARQKKTLVRIIISGVMFFGLMISFHTFAAGWAGTWVAAVLFAVPYLLVGYDVLIKAGKNIAHGEVFDEDFLMIVAGIGAYGTREFEEAVAVMLFFQVGELFQGYAVGKSRQSISDLMDIAPESANLLNEDGSVNEVDPEDVEVGSIVLVRPGEKIPIDGVIVEGDSFVDTSALTGESVPRHAGVGTEVAGGFINGKGTLKCRTTKAYEDSTVARILELVENAGNRKSRTENFITKFAKYYTPAVTISAVILAIVPSIITGNWAEWIQRACTFLVISCPCALVISVPMGFFGGIGASSKAGILVKGSNFLEVFSKLDTVAFDKTGTLTQGKFEVTAVDAKGCSEDELISLAAGAEAYSTHPIAESILRCYRERGLDKGKLTDGFEDHTELSGRGISVDYNGERLLAGNAQLLADNGIEAENTASAGTVVYVAKGGKYLGNLVISDIPKEGIAKKLAELKAAGVSRTVMLTGDRKGAAVSLAADVGIDDVRSDLLPEDKVRAVEELMETCPSGGSVGFVGDGINDAPVLTRADVGIAMGSLGSDAAIEAADIVIMDDDIGKLATGLRIARKTLRIVKENIVFALSIKALVLILGALGIANMWMAVFADVGVAVLAILNSMRALKPDMPKNA